MLDQILVGQVKIVVRIVKEVNNASLDPWVEHLPIHPSLIGPFDLNIQSWRVANGMKEFPIWEKRPQIEQPRTLDFSRL